MQGRGNAGGWGGDSALRCAGGGNAGETLTALRRNAGGKREGKVTSLRYVTGGAHSAALRAWGIGHSALLRVWCVVRGSTTRTTG